MWKIHTVKKFGKQHKYRIVRYMTFQPEKIHLATDNINIDLFNCHLRKLMVIFKPFSPYFF